MTKFERLGHGVRLDAVVALNTRGEEAEDMSTAKPARKRKAAEQPATPSGCNVPGCSAAVYHRGLCDEHWATRRDLADPCRAT